MGELLFQQADAKSSRVLQWFACLWLAATCLRGVTCKQVALKQASENYIAAAAAAAVVKGRRAALSLSVLAIGRA